jgi:hypothetical protein
LLTDAIARQAQATERVRLQESLTTTKQHMCTMTCIQLVWTSHSTLS